MTKELKKCGKELEKSYDVQGILQFLTGFFASSEKEKILSLSYLLQRGRGAGFRKALNTEYKSFQEKGKIKNDYANTEQAYSCLQEILDFIDNDAPDEIRFNAMKALFLSIATEKLSDRDDLIPAELMKICRKLDSAEIITLSSIYKIYKSGQFKTYQRAFEPTRERLEQVTVESSFKFYEITKIAAKELMEKGLIHSSEKGFARDWESFGLSRLGIELCKFIENYEKGQIEDN